MKLQTYYAPMLAILLAVFPASVHAQQICPGGVCRPQQQWGHLPQPAPRQQPQPQQKIFQGVARIVSFDRDGAQSVGSGSLVETTEDYGFVLTNRHVVQDSTGKVHVQLPGDGTYSAKILRVHVKADLALLAVRVPRKTRPIRLAPESPQVGDTCWVMGFGGNQGFRSLRGVIRRTFLDPVSRVRQWLLSVPSRSGDSGGPIVNKSGYLVGVLWGTDYGETCFVGHETIRVFCETYIGPHREKEDSVLVGTDPPDTDEKAPSTPPEGTQAGQGGESHSELVAVLEALRAEIRDIELKPGHPGEKGEPGPAGPAGPAGPQGPPGAGVPEDVLAQINQRLAALEAAQLPVVSGVPPEAVAHFVLVGDQGASYWPRLQDQFNRAREVYHRVVLASPPDYPVGPLPQLVRYEGGTPKQVYKGSREVEEALVALSRGELL